MEQNYLKDLIDRNPGCYETQLVLGMIHSQNVFRQASQFVCPLNPKDMTHRHDFTTRRYNFLFPVISSVWQLFGNQQVAFKIPKALLKAHLEADAQTGILSMQLEVARELLQELDALYPDVDPQPEFLAALLGPGFGYWLDCRIGRAAADMVFNASRATILTPDGLQAILNKFNAGRANLTSRAVSGQDLIKSTIKVQPWLAAHSLPRTMKALGGGFVRGEATMIAGINGGGKTVLATQLTRDFILQGIKVAYVTTEQRPVDMMARILTSHLKVNFERFTNRPEVVGVNPDAVVELSMIPQSILDEPQHQEGLIKMTSALANLQFIDWSDGSGLTVTSNLGPDLDKLALQGFVPQIVIFDWIGSALDHASTKQIELRHLYHQAADFLISYGKQKNLVVIIMAQFDKVAAHNKERPGMNMLSECKTMTNNLTNFIGITALMEQGSTSQAVFRHKQNLFMAKTRSGVGGLIPFNRDFHIQTLTEIKIA